MVREQWSGMSEHQTQDTSPQRLSSGHLRWAALSVIYLPHEELQSWSLEIGVGEKEAITPPTGSFQVRGFKAVFIG